MTKGRRISDLEKKISKKQEKLMSLKDQYDAVAKEIEELLKSKKEAEKLDMIDAFEKSGRSYEEMMEFMKTAPVRVTKTVSGRRGRPKKSQ